MQEIKFSQETAICNISAILFRLQIADIMHCQYYHVAVIISIYAQFSELKLECICLKNEITIKLNYLSKLS